MKRIAFLLMATCLLTSCVSIVETTKRAPKEVQQRSLKGFERIRLMGSPTVYYAQADTFSVSVKAPKEIFDNIITEVNDGSLEIKTENHGDIFMRFDEVEVHVTSPDLVEVSLVGSGDFMSKYLVDTDQLLVTLKGSGDVTFADIICDRITTSLVGSGDMKIEHVKALRSDVELVGSGDLEIAHEQVAATQIVLKGSGDVAATFDRCGAVAADLRGSGSIALSGTVSSLEQNTLGSGEIETNRLQIVK